MRETTRKPTTTEGVKSLSSWDGRDSAYDNFCLGSSPVKALWESEQEKASVQESSLNLHSSSPRDLWETTRASGRRFFGLMRSKWSGRGWILMQSVLLYYIFFIDYFLFCKFLSKKLNYIDFDSIYKINKRGKHSRGRILFMGTVSFTWLHAPNRDVHTMMLTVFIVKQPDGRW